MQIQGPRESCKPQINGAAAVVVVVAHSSSPSLVVVELEKISHRIWIVPWVLSCQLCRACRALEQMFNEVWFGQTSVTPAVMRAL